MKSAFKLMMLMLCILIVPVFARIYHIPEDLMNEVKANQAALQLAPNSADAHFELAMSYGYTGQIEKGWAELKGIPHYDPQYAPKVIEKYGALTETSPKEWKNWFKLAFGYYFADQKDKALECFQKVLDIDPKHIWAMGFMGLLEGERGNTDKGIEWSKKALVIEPNATAIHFLLAEGYRRKGDYLKTLAQVLIVGRLKSEEALKR